MNTNPACSQFDSLARKSTAPGIRFATMGFRLVEECAFH